MESTIKLQVNILRGNLYGAPVKDADIQESWTRDFPWSWSTPPVHGTTFRLGKGYSAPASRVVHESFGKAVAHIDLCNEHLTFFAENKDDSFTKLETPPTSEA